MLISYIISIPLIYFILDIIKEKNLYIYILWETRTNIFLHCRLQNNIYTEFYKKLQKCKSMINYAQKHKQSGNQK